MLLRNRNIREYLIILTHFSAHTNEGVGQVNKPALTLFIALVPGKR